MNRVYNADGIVNVSQFLPGIRIALPPPAFEHCPVRCDKHIKMFIKTEDNNSTYIANRRLGSVKHRRDWGDKSHF